MARSWDSVQGTRTVVGEDTFQDCQVVLVATEGRGGSEIVSADELEELIEFEQRQVASRRRGQEALEQERQQAEEEESLRGFEETLSAAGAARASAVLNRLRLVRGEQAKLKHHIEQLVREGYVVVSTPKRGRILEHPDGGFFLQKDLTKTALDYAEYIRRLAPPLDVRKLPASKGVAIRCSNKIACGFVFIAAAQLQEIDQDYAIPVQKRGVVTIDARSLDSMSSQLERFDNRDYWDDIVSDEHRPVNMTYEAFQRGMADAFDAIDVAKRKAAPVPIGKLKSKLLR